MSTDLLLLSMIINMKSGSLAQFILLKHQPHHFNIILGMAPVPQGIEISKIKAILEPKIYPGQGSRDFPGNKGFTPYGRFMIKEYAVACIDVIGFAVVYCNPVGIQLRLLVYITAINVSICFIRFFATKRPAK